MKTNFNKKWQKLFDKLSKNKQALILASPMGREAAKLAVKAFN